MEAFVEAMKGAHRLRRSVRCTAGCRRRKGASGSRIVGRQRGIVKMMVEEHNAKERG